MFNIQCDKKDPDSPTTLALCSDLEAISCRLSNLLLSAEEDLATETKQMTNISACTPRDEQSNNCVDIVCYEEAHNVSELARDRYNSLHELVQHVKQSSTLYLGNVRFIIHNDGQATAQAAQSVRRGELLMSIPQPFLLVLINLKSECPLFAQLNKHYTSHQNLGEGFDLGSLKMPEESLMALILLHFKHTPLDEQLEAWTQHRRSQRLARGVSPLQGEQAAATKALYRLKLWQQCVRGWPEDWSNHPAYYSRAEAALMSPDLSTEHAADMSYVAFDFQLLQVGQWVVLCVSCFYFYNFSFDPSLSLSLSRMCLINYNIFLCFFLSLSFLLFLSKCICV